MERLCTLEKHEGCPACREHDCWQKGSCCPASFPSHHGLLLLPDDLSAGPLVFTLLRVYGPAWPAQVANVIAAGKAATIGWIDWAPPTGPPLTVYLLLTVTTKSDKSATIPLGCGPGSIPGQVRLCSGRHFVSAVHNSWSDFCYGFGYSFLGGKKFGSTLEDPEGLHSLLDSGLHQRC